jgi:hypothetical protein
MGTKLSNSEITPHAVWPLAKFFMTRDKPNAPTAIHSPSDFKFLSLDKTNVIADFLEKPFLTRDLCEENHERLLEAHIQAFLEPVDNNTPDCVTCKKTLKF